MKQPSLVTGIDDATKCPCIGSIFLAGVSADEKTIELWKKAGVKDSKLVAPKKRERLFGLIKETAAAYSITHMPPERIDDKRFNLNMWEMITVLQLSQRILEKLPIRDILIDNWEVSTEHFHARKRSIDRPSIRKELREANVRLNYKKLAELNLLPEHHADETYTIVGAASILAKVSSDRQYKRFKKIYGDFGSGSPGDPKTRRYVWENRLEPTPIIRQSWKTYTHLAGLERIEDDHLFKHRTIRKRA